MSEVRQELWGGFVPGELGLIRAALAYYLRRFEHHMDDRVILQDMLDEVDRWLWGEAGK